MSSLTTLSLIGHCGNFIIEMPPFKKDAKFNDSIHKMALYSDTFDFVGTQDLFAGTGILTAFDSEMGDLGKALTSSMESSHNVKMLTFGLDTIFQVGQNGWLPNLESLSLLKYVDLSNIMSGLKIPSPVSLLPGKGKKR